MDIVDCSGAQVMPALARVVWLGFLLSFAPAAALAAKAPPRSLVREFKFEGNTVFSEAQLQGVVAVYTHRKLSDAQIEQARIQVSRYYIDHGYTNSGALLKGRDAKAGIVTFRIVEGKVGTIHVAGNRWVGTSYIKSRISRGGADAPYNANKTADNIATIRREDLNESILGLDADLQPGTEPGDGVLDVTVKDRQPFRASLVYDNRRPAGVGAQEISLIAQDVNLTGDNDPLEVDYVIARQTRDGFGFTGGDDLAVTYTRPITPSDTTISLHYSRADFAVIEAPFQNLEIDSNEDIYSISLRQPLIERKDIDLGVAVQMDREESHTSLLGVPFTLSPGEINGTAKLTVFRFVQDFTLQRDADVLALRSTFNVGTRLFGGTGDTDGRGADFFSWRGEGQYVRKLFGSDNLLVLRANGQATPDPLLVLEQYSVGGRFSVRGYRENELVRDNGYFISAEVRVPLLKRKDGDPILQLAPFSDLGGGFNNDAPTPKPRLLASIGVGLLITYKPWINYAELYYGYALKSAPQPAGGDRDLQDDGINFFIQVAAF
jgi:hemolysin activation/secretion protein